MTNLELMLKYCNRFYDRQFITREHVNEGILVKFEDILNTYLKSEKLQNEGIPTLTYFADQLNLSTNYFGDLVKKETSTTALEYIHLKIMDLAKAKLMDSTFSVSEVSYQLGFKYPQHFTRFFKQKVGLTPMEWRGNWAIKTLSKFYLGILNFDKVKRFYNSRFLKDFTAKSAARAVSAM